MMRCKGRFIFKGIRAKDGGEFTNANGQKIQYQPSYEVKFDDVDENNVINERKVKVSLEQKELVEKLMVAKVYSPLVFEFEIGFNSKGTSLKLLDVSEVKKSE